MNICFDVSPAIYQRAGIGRYTQELFNALVNSDAENNYLAFYNSPGKPQHEIISHQYQHLSIQLADKPWRLLVFLSYLLNLSQEKLFRNVDLFHATDHLLPWLPNIKRVLTIYDLTYILFPRHHTPLNRLFLKLMVPKYLTNANSVIVISESTKKDIICHYQIAPKKIKVIYLGVNPTFHACSLNEIDTIKHKYQLPDEYLLFVGRLEPRKNLITLINAVKILYERGGKNNLVLVGKSGWYYQSFLNEIHKANLTNFITTIGFVCEEDLPAIYSGAQVFIYPSLYEGFGLPILEAMACNTPVICSNTSSMPEISGQAAIMIDPHNAEELADVICRVVHDKEMQEELRLRGLAQAQKFTWERAAIETIQLYKTLLP